MKGILQPLFFWVFEVNREHEIASGAFSALLKRSATCRWG